MRLLIAIASVLCLASPADAYVSGGHEYRLTCNEDGYVLRSVNDVVRTRGSGAGTQFVKGRESLYLGRDCDAYHRLYGEGKWCWANGGFVAEFTQTSFGFARQELVCPREPEFELNCRC